MKIDLLTLSQGDKIRTRGNTILEVVSVSQRDIYPIYPIILKTKEWGAYCYTRGGIYIKNEMNDEDIVEIIKRIDLNTLEVGDSVRTKTFGTLQVRKLNKTDGSKFYPISITAQSGHIYEYTYWGTYSTGVDGMNIVEIIKKPKIDLETLEVGDSVRTKDGSIEKVVKLHKVPNVCPFFVGVEINRLDSYRCYERNGEISQGWGWTSNVDIVEIIKKEKGVKVDLRNLEVGDTVELRDGKKRAVTRISKAVNNKYDIRIWVDIFRKDFTFDGRISLLKGAHDFDIIKVIKKNETSEFHSSPEYDQALKDWENKNPKTMTLNGITFPEPVGEPLENGRTYYRADTCKDFSSAAVTWENDEYDYGNLRKGIIQLTAEGAELQSQAMLAPFSNNQTK